MNLSNIYNEIVNMYYPRIYYYCLNQKLNPQDAEDCTQEVFLILWRKFNSINHEENIRGWLYATSDVIIKRHRSKNKKNLNNKNFDDLPDDIFSLNPFDSLNTGIELNEVLAALNPDDRKLISDYYVYGKTCVELAVELKTTAEAVRQRLNRARNRFFVRLKEYDSALLTK